jgi:hypothetical protein
MDDQNDYGTGRQENNYNKNEETRMTRMTERQGEHIGGKGRQERQGI